MMSEGVVGIGILTVVAVVTGVVSHRLIHNYVLAAAAAAAIATLTFQLIVRWQLGYLDSFFPIAVVVSGAFAFLIALVVGVSPAVRTNADEAEIRQPRPGRLGQTG